MNIEQIVEILEAYRPGEDLESDPVVREALKAAEADPVLARIRDQVDEFDAAFADAVQRIPVPDDLQQKILQAARLGDLTRQQVAPLAANRILRWLHPATFGIAAAVVIMLALTFTFWSKPDLNESRIALAQDPISAAAQAVYASLNPAFKSRDGEKVRDYLVSKNGFAPETLPGDVVWNKAFACDVIEINGRKVSIICFMAPDSSRSMHLFTFLREEFPEVDVPSRPVIRRSGNACCAQWGDDRQIHVLYSDKGEENLRKILDI